MQSTGTTVSFLSQYIIWVLIALMMVSLTLAEQSCKSISDSINFNHNNRKYNNRRYSMIFLLSSNFITKVHEKKTFY